MTRRQASKHLKSVLKLVDNGTPAALRSNWVAFVLWLLLVALLTVILQFSTSAPLIVTIGICFFLGAFCGAYSVYHTAARQWPFLSPHINRESVVQRINELNP